MQKEWVLSLRDQCERAHVLFFFKQWGGVRKSKAGRKLDGKKYDGLPSRVELPVLDNGRRLAAIAETESIDLSAWPPPEVDGSGFPFDEAAWLADGVAEALLGSPFADQMGPSSGS